MVYMAIFQVRNSDGRIGYTLTDIPSVMPYKIAFKLVKTLENDSWKLVSLLEVIKKPEIKRKPFESDQLSF